MQTQQHKEVRDVYVCNHQQQLAGIPQGGLNDSTAEQLLVVVVVLFWFGVRAFNRIRGIHTAGSEPTLLE